MKETDKYYALGTAIAELENLKQSLEQINGAINVLQHENDIETFVSVKHIHGNNFIPIVQINKGLVFDYLQKEKSKHISKLKEQVAKVKSTIKELDLTLEIPVIQEVESILKNE